MEVPDTTAGYLASASAVIKALKANDDPPQSGWPEKIDIAREAWLATDLYVPKKAEVIREWIIETWTRRSALLADERYHALLLEVWSPSANSPPPLSLLASFFSVAKAACAYDTASKSLLAMFSDVPAFKAEAWLEVWVAMVSSKCRQKDLIELGTRGLRESLDTSTNARKLIMAALPHLPVLALAHADSEAMVASSTESLLLPLMPNLHPFLEALKPAGSPAHTFLPVVLEVYIRLVREHRYELFAQPSTSRASLDIVAKDKERAAVRNATASILSTLPADAWNLRGDIWRLVEAWGGFLETDRVWYGMVQVAAQEAAHSLSDNKSAKDILPLLDTLERLCHSAAEIGSNTIGWCLACPKSCRTEALQLLSSIQRYHRLAHTLPDCFSLLTATVQQLFPDNLPDDAAKSLYGIVEAGPLFDRRFRQEIARSVRGMRRGRNEVTQICLQQLLRPIETASEAACFAIHGQLLALMVQDGSTVEELENTVLSLPPPKRRKLDWNSDLVESTRLKLARTLTSVNDNLLSSIDISQTRLEGQSARLVIEYLLLATHKASQEPSQESFIPILLKSAHVPHFWDLVSEKSLTVLDAIAQPSELEAFWRLVASSNTVPDRLLGNAEIWELPRLHDALATVLLQVESVALLGNVPTRILSPTLIAKLVRWATKRDKRFPEERIAIRRWLAQMGVTDLKYLRRLVKTTSEDSILVDVTVDLLERSFLLLARDEMIALKDDLLAKTDEHDRDLRLRAGFIICKAALKRIGSLEDFNDLVERLITSSNGRVERAVSESQLPELWWVEGCMTLRTLCTRLQRQPPRLGAQLAVLLIKRPDPVIAPRTLQLLADEGYVALQILAFYLSFKKVAPSGDLDNAMRDFMRRVSTLDFQAVFESVVAMHDNREVLQMLLRVSVKGSGHIVSRHLSELIMPVDLEVIKALVEQRSHVLHEHDLSLIWSAINHILVDPSHPTGQTTPSPSHMISCIIDILNLAIRSRPDLVRLTLPQLVDCVTALFPVLRRPASASASASSSLPTRDRQPGSQWHRHSKWQLTPDEIGSHAASASRLLASLASMECASLAKHVTPIVLAYAQSVANPISRLEQTTRAVLEPGVFALCQVVAKGGVMTARGREGEGIGTPYGLGEGGEGEKQVWAELWTTWGRRRYTGRG